MWSHQLSSAADSPRREGCIWGGRASRWRSSGSEQRPEESNQQRPAETTIRKLRLGCAARAAALLRRRPYEGELLVRAVLHLPKRPFAALGTPFPTDAPEA